MSCAGARLLFWLVIAGCREQASSDAPSARAPNVSTPTDSIRCDTCGGSGSAALTAYERCALNAYQARNLAADKCMIRCLSRGKARNIAGGCFHACYAFTGVPMVFPPGLDRCEKLNTPADTATTDEKVQTEGR